MWGYCEEAANVRQDEMRIFYEIWFTPRRGISSEEYPPRLIVVPGQE